jgi:hypothetical protein
MIEELTCHSTNIFWSHSVDLFADFLDGNVTAEENLVLGNARHPSLHAISREKCGSFQVVFDHLKLIFRKGLMLETIHALLD